jgi:hypothetical protein
MNAKTKNLIRQLKTAQDIALGMGFNHGLYAGIYRVEGGEQANKAREYSNKSLEKELKKLDNLWDALAEAINDNTGGEE